jgi:hypothetical protein
VLNAINSTSAINTTGDITVGNVNTGGRVSATGNLVTAANVLVAGDYVQIPISASDPASPVAGALYYNTGTGALRLWTGSFWDNV